MTISPPLADKLVREIRRGGPMPVSQFMAEANAHYYATRDPLGAAGDFITAPEISQMFGELVGLWLADLWLHAGSPMPVRYVELGPGRGTLAADALRAMASVGLRPQVDFIETSLVLRQAQRERVPDAMWHDSLADLPHDAPLLVVANEFFDALPVRQIVSIPMGWRERAVTHDGERFVPVLGEPVPPPPMTALAGTIVESCPAAKATAADLAARLADLGGAAIIIDYGHAGPATGDTLQAVRGHGFADPFADPGEHDLTAHVDFTALAREGRSAGLRAYGPVNQGDWLEGLGLSARAALLTRNHPDQAEALTAARDRLAAPQQMGTLFKALAFIAPEWPEPEGFA